MSIKKNNSSKVASPASKQATASVAKKKPRAIKVSKPKVVASKAVKKISQLSKSPKSSAPATKAVLGSTKGLKGRQSVTNVDRPTGVLEIVQFCFQPSDKKQCESLWRAEATGSAMNTWQAIETWHREHRVSGKLWGVAPRQFAQLTGISAVAWNQGVLANPGRDVYFCNPLPAEEAIYPNPHTRWLAEVPGAASVWQALMTDLGQVHWPQAYWPSGTFMVPHFWVATPAFITAYRTFVQQSMGRLEKVLSKRVSQNWHQPGVWSAYPEESLYSLVAAYLLPVFLRTSEGQSFKAFKIMLPQAEARLNAHLRSLRSLKDAAISGRSLWLAQVWLNYRNLYLLQVQGQRWCDRYLRSITPSAIHLLDLGGKSSSESSPRKPH